MILSHLHQETISIHSYVVSFMVYLPENEAPHVNPDSNRTVISEGKK